MREMGHILKETIGNHSFINRVLRNGQYVFNIGGIRDQNVSNLNS